ERRLRQHDGELVASDAAGDVRGSNDATDSPGRLREDGVAGEVADLVVDVLEVVQVEDDERELSVVAVRASDLACKRLVEEAAVVEPGQRVEVGELPRLAKATGVVDRGPGVRSERLELADVVFAKGPSLLPGEDRQVSHRSALARHR